MRRVVQKRADDADKRKREEKAKIQDDSVVAGEQEVSRKRKAEDKERLAREAKVRRFQSQPLVGPSCVVRV